MLVTTKRRAITAAAISFVVVFILAMYWWQTFDEHANLSNLFSKLNLSTASNSDGIAVGDKVAVIVETRPLRVLIPLITHFAAVLGPEWPILLFTRPSTVRTLAAFGQGSQPFRRMVKAGQVKIIELPTRSYLQNYEGISHFLASEWFWTQLEPAKHMLLFQADSMICSSSGRRVEDFLEYDFIGATHPYFDDAFNGGLSLRNVTLSRQIAKMSNIADDINNGTNLGLVEDVWFCDKMKKLGARFPTQEKAAEFAVDYNWAERPLGYHGINKTANVERSDEIYAWCPEAQIAAASNDVLELSEEERNSTNIVEDVEATGGRILPFE